MLSRLKDTLLLVGNEKSDRPLLREIFESSYNILEADNASQASMLLEQNSGCIAAVLSDLPLKNGSETRKLIAACHMGHEDEIPVVLFVPNSGKQEELALSLGATDVTLKPYNPLSVQKRVHAIVDLFLHKWHLETMVQEQSETIRNTSQVMVDALSAIIEHRNTESGNHVLRIRRFTKILLEAVASACPEYGLTESSIDIMASAATLHDIGKISIPDSILNKPTGLTTEEFEVMKTHTTVGSELIQNLSGMGDVEYLRYAYNICLYHHERWDGSGYPYGLRGDNIPICAQAVGIADAFDALTTPRVYKPAYPYEQAFNMILNGECGAFSEKLLECFKNVRTQFVALATHYADGNSPKSDTITMPLPGPVWKTHQLNSLQLSYVKYQALLHYIDDTIMELDLDNDLYHIVYNPNPDLDSILPNAPLSEILNQLEQSIAHPGDRKTVKEIRRFLKEDFFQLNLRRKSFSCRIYSPSLSAYQPYELVFLRVNTGNKDQKIVVAVWKWLERELPEQLPLPQSNLHSSPALYGLVSSALRCHSDHALTIDAGKKDLFHLTGYTEEEIERLFHNSLLEMVLPEDRKAFSEAMDIHLKMGGKTETEYRLQRKNAPPVWVLDKSRVYIEDDKQEYFYHAIRDNSRGKETQNRLESAIERSQLVIDQTEGIVFEWDLAEDILTCSSKWEKHFGYPNLSKNFSARIAQASHFHPDDLPLLRNKIASIQSHSSSANVEVRIANSEGKYLWCRIRASSLFSSDGNPMRIIGVVTDIDDLKRAEIALKERAERDALTKLLNKASTQQLVEEHLSSCAPQSISAMLILDLDNFKFINDTYGHLYGDALLSQIGATLRRLFRSHDIIGRIGGDEFLILLKDIPGEETVLNRCELLLDTFRELLSQHSTDVVVSCSIGAAIAPNHGTTYAELFQHADDSLYVAKGKGKNQYKLYDPMEQFAPLIAGDTHTSTRIDSDELPGMADNSFIRFVFRRLYESQNIEDTINDILTYIGEQFNVSRVYIFENNDDNTCCSNTFEWCNKGIHPEIENLQDVSYITDVPGWPEVFDERGVFYCTDITTLAPHFRAILEPQGIKSMLQCAIMDSGVFRGYVGFDECTINRMWTQDQITLLAFLAEVLAMFLLKKRTQDKATMQATNLQSILDNQNAWVYVIDPETCELKFLNAKTKQLAPDTRPGMICYKTFMARDTRCENCPALNINHTKNASAMIVNKNYGLQVHSLATEISWNGEAACLLTCHELKK